MRPTQDEFDKRVAEHRLTILRDDGLYRHLRFRRPGTGIDGFDIVTWPGFLCYCGDMGDYVFQRCEDMLSFFRRGDGGIDPQYWAEKVVAQDRDGVTEYSADKFHRVVNEILDEHKASQELRQDVENEVLSVANEGEYAAHRAASEFHFRSVDEDEEEEFQFYDFHEYDLREYTYRFIFCCYALALGIKRYDETKRKAV